MSFITNAIAGSPTQQVPAADGTFSLIMIVAIFILFYLMLIRPQNKRAKEQREMLSKLKKGDEVVTAGGILAKIVYLDDNYIKVSLNEGMEVTMQRNAVNIILPKGTLKSIGQV